MKLKALFLAVFILSMMVACGTNDGQRDDLSIEVLSNRADLISGGDALVKVGIPAGVYPADVRVAVDGRDVTSAFAVRSDGRYYGLIMGLNLGANEVTVSVEDSQQSLLWRRKASITITNHSIGGPVFSGAQLRPWICARREATLVTVTDPVTYLSAAATTRVSGLDEDPYDDQCDAATKFTYYYQPKSKEGTACTFTISGANPCFQPYDPDYPPADADIADFTNDRGDKVKSIVVFEQGTINRGIYHLVTFYDPTKPFKPWASQKGWNGKLLWKFGGGSGGSRFQEVPVSSAWDNDALKLGFMVAVSSLTDHSLNSNDTLAAETVMMVKEHIIETYGEIRYTIGQGSSGGAILQQNIASAYPGLLNGIRPGASFPDTQTTSIEVADCGLLQNEYYKNTVTGLALGEEKKAAINGHLTSAFCTGWVNSYLPTGSATRSENCGAGFPADLVYDPVLRPNGIRCSSYEHVKGLLGTYVDVDGVTKAVRTLDNEGVQYGLNALQNGVISAEEFVALNENIGGHDADGVWTGPASAGSAAPRIKASANVLDKVYSAGLVTSGRQLAKVPIIDLRHTQIAGDIHMNWRAWSIRDRLDKANGNHDNHLIWAYALTASAGLTLNSLLTIDAWLANIENDITNRSLDVKVTANKPADAADRCLSAPDTEVCLDSEDCPVKYQGSPRQAAGGPLAENILKCQLKALNFNDADYSGITFTEDQKNRLARTFPNGVCDWSKAGVGQSEAYGWATFVDGPGGRPLGDAPVSRTH